jgi:hypothetical protein
MPYSLVNIVIMSTTLSGGHIGFTGILSFYGSLPRLQLEDGSDQTAQWIDHPVPALCP